MARKPNPQNGESYELMRELEQKTASGEQPAFKVTGHRSQGHSWADIQSFEGMRTTKLPDSVEWGQNSLSHADNKRIAELKEFIAWCDGQHYDDVRRAKLTIPERTEIFYHNSVVGVKYTAASGSRYQEFNGTIDTSQIFHLSEASAQALGITLKGEPAKKKAKSMKIENMVAIGDETSTTLKGIFGDTASSGKRGGEYTFRVPLALEAKKDDRLLVETELGLSVIIVTEVHEFTEIEPDDERTYRWAFARVDTAPLAELKTRDAEQAKVLAAARRRNIQQQVIAQYAAGGAPQLEVKAKGEQF